MSYEYAQTLLRRAEAFLEASRNSYEKGYWDVACVEAEIAAQLALKALIAKIGLTPPQINGIRRLVKLVARLHQDIGEKLVSHTKSIRERVIVLERCREIGQHSPEPADEEEAYIALEAAKDLVEFTKNLVESLNN